MGNCHLIEPLENYPVSSRRRRLITSNVSPLDRSDKNTPYCATAYKLFGPRRNQTTDFYNNTIIANIYLKNCSRPRIDCF